MNAFHDRVILVTGAASGIGREFVNQLHPQGARIAALDMNEAGLAELSDEFGERLAWAKADVTQQGELDRAVAELEQKLGPIDILIACAGIGRETHALDYDPADMELMLRVNLIGVANSFSAVLPGMRERRRGQLVALSSLASYHGLPRMGAYCASKAGVNALCDAFRVELKPLDIAVTAICPGFIRTPMTAQIINMKRHPGLIEVDYAVRRMLDAIRRKQAYAAFPFSSWFRVCLLRYLPRPIADWMAGRLYRQSLQE